MGYKIIDYAGDTLEKGFVSYGAAWHWIYQRYTSAAIKELEVKVIREEEKDERDSSEL